MTSTTSKALPLLTVSRWRGYRGKWGEEEGSMSLRNARRTVQHITGFSCNFVHVREGRVQTSKDGGKENRATIQVQGTDLSTRIERKNLEPLLVEPVALSADDGQQCRGCS